MHHTCIRKDMLVGWRILFYGLRTSSDKFSDMTSRATATPETHKLRRVLVAVRTYAAYGRRIIDGIIDFADRQLAWELESSRNPSELYLGRKPDGVITNISTGPQAELIETFHRQGIPCVAVTDPESPFPQVLIDNVAVGEMAAKHLLQRGFDQLGFLAYDLLFFARQRKNGLVGAARQAGASVHLFPLTPAGEPEITVEAWLEQLPRPVGILAAEDMTAVHLANVCREVKAMVPQQVAIIGVDNDSRACRMTTPPLSSIDHGAREVGFEAAGLLERLMAGQGAPEQPLYVPPSRVVERQSTNTLAIDHPQVARAARFIHDSFHEGITPRDVVAKIPMARRSLETAFRRCLGRTILQEIRRVRIERVKHLLFQTDLAMPEICELTGFTSPSRLSQAFKSAVGVPPTHYRRASRL